MHQARAEADAWEQSSRETGSEPYAVVYKKFLEAEVCDALHSC